MSINKYMERIEMKSREMRMQFRPLNGFEKQYKVNYLGEIYSIKYKKLKGRSIR